MADSKVTTGYPTKSKVSSPLRSLYEATGNQKLVFPMDLAGASAGGDSSSVNEPFISFKVAKYRREVRQDIPKKETIATVHLPIPATLAVNYSAQYNTSDLGITAGGLARNANFNKTAEDIIEGRIFDALGSGSEIDVEELKSRGFAALARNLTRKIGSSLNVNVYDAAQIALGKAINPHTAAVFQNMNFRQHQFVYRFMARNQKESDALRSIIDLFRYSMHPQFGELVGNRTTSVLEFPEQWFLSFSKPHRQYLYDFLPCVMTAFNVSYNGSNIPAFFETTKAPVDMELTLNFQEIEIVTKEQLDREQSVRHFSRGGLNE